MTTRSPFPVSLAAMLGSTEWYSQLGKMSMRPGLGCLHLVDTTPHAAQVDVGEMEGGRILASFDLGPRR